MSNSEQLWADYRGAAREFFIEVRMGLRVTVPTRIASTDPERRKEENRYLRMETAWPGGKLMVLEPGAGLVGRWVAWWSEDQGDSGWLVNSRWGATVGTAKSATLGGSSLGWGRINLPQHWMGEMRIGRAELNGKENGLLAYGEVVKPIRNRVTEILLARQESWGAWFRPCPMPELPSLDKGVEVTGWKGRPTLVGVLGASVLGDTRFTGAELLARWADEQGQPIGWSRVFNVAEALERRGKAVELDLVVAPEWEEIETILRGSGPGREI